MNTVEQFKCIKIYCKLLNSDNYKSCKILSIDIVRVGKIVESASGEKKICRSENWVDLGIRKGRER